ncbi:MAG: peroxidase-related enzyme [Anaerolineae bacterium]|nr:peroxidase-related enzyme [Anaerolineae bacterium]
MRHHARNLRQLTKQDALVEQLSSDYRLAALNAADRAMLDYAAKLTLTPTAITEQDVQGLRATGFTDRAILDIVQITAYYAYVNRIADGLGVSLEAYWQHGDTPEAE